MKKYFLALTLVTLLSLKLTNAIDFNFKEKVLIVSYNNQEKEFSESEIDLIKVDYGFFKNIKSKKYTINKASEVKILKDFKLKTKAVDARFNKEKNIIKNSENGYELKDKIFELEKVNELSIKPIEAEITNEDALKQKNNFNEILLKKITIDGKESEIKVDPKWIDLHKDSASINNEKLKQAILKEINKGKSDEIKLKLEGENVLLSERLSAIKKIKSIEIKDSIDIKTKDSYPEIKNEKGEKLNILSIGKSNFEGSIPNRIYNVKEGAKVFSNIILKAGDIFSYNNTLATKGANVVWKNAYIIVNGKDLKLSPGGGLCQTSTTLFRAALKAGLDIKKWKNHSIYVSYYSQFGDGIDSTIFPGKQDLLFENPYKNDIYIISDVDEFNNMYTYMIGKDTPKKVEFNGPFTGN